MATMRIETKRRFLWTILVLLAPVFLARRLSMPVVPALPPEHKQTMKLTLGEDQKLQVEIRPPRGQAVPPGCVSNAIALSEAPSRTSFRKLAAEVSAALVTAKCDSLWAKQRFWEVLFFEKHSILKPSLTKTINGAYLKGSFYKETIEVPTYDLDNILQKSCSDAAPTEVFIQPKLMCQKDDSLVTGAVVEANAIVQSALFLTGFSSLQALADAKEIKDYADGLFVNMRELEDFSLRTALASPPVLTRWNLDRMGLSNTIHMGTSETDLATANWVAAYESIHRAVLKSDHRHAHLSVELVKALHQRLAQDSRQNDVVPGGTRRGATLVSGRNVLPAHFVDHALSLSVEWFNKAEHFESIGSLVSALAVFYSECASIHPFLDANGRACRAAVDFVLLSANLPPLQFEHKAHNDVLLSYAHSVDDQDAINYRISNLIGVDIDTFAGDGLKIKDWLTNGHSCENADLLASSARNFDGEDPKSFWGSGENQATLEGPATKYDTKDRLTIALFSITNPAAKEQFEPFLKHFIYNFARGLQHAIATSKAAMAQET